MKNTVLIDGSHGEGGGQVLRTALTLSVITGKPFNMINIRARRSKSGLMAQHLKAVEAAAKISGAHVSNIRTGSTTLQFEPKGLYHGDYQIHIETAGATTLVLQTILVPLSFANGPSYLTITGGTHVPWAPCYHFLSEHWWHYMTEIGFAGELKLGSAGFYPEGGGCLQAQIAPMNSVKTLKISERGNLTTIKGISAIANLDISVAERQRQQAEFALQNRGYEATFNIMRMPSKYKSTMLMLLAEFEKSRCCYYALGARGKRAEKVADEAVASFFEFMDTDGAIDQYVTDQLILPLIFAQGESVLHTCKITQHLKTIIDIIRMFIDIDIRIDGNIGTAGFIRIFSG